MRPDCSAPGGSFPASQPGSSANRERRASAEAVSTPRESASRPARARRGGRPRAPTRVHFRVAHDDRLCRFHAGHRHQLSQHGRVGLGRGPASGPAIARKYLATPHASRDQPRETRPACSRRRPSNARERPGLEDLRDVRHETRLRDGDLRIPLAKQPHALGRALFPTASSMSTSSPCPTISRTRPRARASRRSSPSRSRVRPRSRRNRRSASRQGRDEEDGCPRLTARTRLTRRAVEAGQMRHRRTIPWMSRRRASAPRRPRADPRRAPVRLRWEAARPRA